MNQDALSTSSELLDLLMHEDARSGTGSNVSGSVSLGSGSGSGSHGTSTSHTGTVAAPKVSCAAGSRKALRLWAESVMLHHVVVKSEKVTRTPTWAFSITGEFQFDL